MVYTITGLKKIDFGATGNMAILQNASFLLSTVLNSCPMYRNAGWIPPIDDPLGAAKTKIASQIVQMYAEHLPKIKVEDIVFTTDEETGKLSVKVKVVIKDGEI